MPCNKIDKPLMANRFLGNVMTSITNIAYIMTFESRHEISNNVICAISNGSDQSAHTRRLIRALASRLNIL